ncbi:MAG: mechanosensitive ion channel domain-containing protein [Planctomycetota bacterium]
MNAGSLTRFSLRSWTGLFFIFISGGVARSQSMMGIQTQHGVRAVDSTASWSAPQSVVVDSTRSATMTPLQSATEARARLLRLEANAPPIVDEVAGRNADVVQEWIDVYQSNASLQQRLAEANDQLAASRRDLEEVQSKLARYGLTPTIGMLLRHKREQLETWRTEGSRLLLATKDLAESQQRQLELEMEPLDGSEPVIQAQRILDQSLAVPGAKQGAAIRRQLEDLLRQRHAWIVSLDNVYRDQQSRLGELDSSARMLKELADEYRQLIDRHVIWIRSDDAVDLDDIRNLKGGVATLFDARRSADFGPTLQRKWQADSGSGIALVALVLGALVVRWRLKSWLIGVGKRRWLAKASLEWRSVVSSVLTVMVALMIPVVLALVARWLGTGIVSESTLHASSAFYAGSLVALFVELLRQLMRNHGYVDQCCGVEVPTRQRASKYLTVVGSGVTVAAYAITLIRSIDHGIWRGSAARFGFIVTMMLVAWTAHICLRPRGGFLEPWISRLSQTMWRRFRFVIYLAGIGTPLALIVLSCLGYGYTANELLRRALITGYGLVVWATLWPGLKTLASSAWQWLTGTNASPVDHHWEGSSSEAPDGKPAVGRLAEHYLELKHHLAFLCQGAFCLVGAVAIGWLWIDVFPNLRMGNPIVWHVQDTIMQPAVDASGETRFASVTTSTPITALHLMAAAATLFVAFQLAKLLPALFDAWVLQRVSFDEGMEHFSLVLGRFLLFGLGCFLACRWIGVRWQSIQWLAVGLTVGLGFGLQDMVRSVFSGLIVLFEKPARLGDLVTVGDVTGRVAAQRLRTTVLSDDDGREMVVPNQNFVRKEVINWMGAGRLQVVPLEVAVSREIRPADICRTLQEFVTDQAEVLVSPQPQATLVCVGKHSQRIEVRAWIEANANASRFRDSLLRSVRERLRRDSLLTSDQPSQPEMLDVMSDESDRERRRRKRRVA